MALHGTLDGHLLRSEEIPAPSKGLSRAKGEQRGCYSQKGAAHRPEPVWSYHIISRASDA